MIVIDLSLEEALPVLEDLEELSPIQQQIGVLRQMIAVASTSVNTEAAQECVVQLREDLEALLENSRVNETVDAFEKTNRIQPQVPTGGYWVNVNKHIVGANAEHGRMDPPIRVSKGKRGRPGYGFEVRLPAGSTIHYSRDDALLKCGAKVAIHCPTEPEIVK